jgi:Flp pilus assembly protein TadG
VSRRVRSRTNQRGAALVEAAVVIPAMLIFLGCIVFTHTSYSAKMDKQMGTRAGALYFASHNCDGQPPADMQPAVEQGYGAENPDLGGKNAGALNSDGLNAGLKQTSAMAHASPGDTPVYGKAVTDGRTIYLNRQIHAESEVHCNERSYPSKWTAVVKYALGMK